MEHTAKRIQGLKSTQKRRVIMLLTYWRNSCQCQRSCQEVALALLGMLPSKKSCDQAVMKNNNPW